MAQYGLPLSLDEIVFLENLLRDETQRFNIAKAILAKLQPIHEDARQDARQGLGRSPKSGN